MCSFPDSSITAQVLAPVPGRVPVANHNNVAGRDAWRRRGGCGGVEEQRINTSTLLEYLRIEERMAGEGRQMGRGVPKGKVWTDGRKIHSRLFTTGE